MADETILLYSYFEGHGDGLHLAVSRDGFEWHALNGDHPFITPEVGDEKLMRDPFVLAGHDGKCHLVWTSGWRGREIGYAFSDDLVHWSDQRLLPVMQHESHAQNCWAPEIFYDADSGNYLVYWATSIPGRFPDTDHSGDEMLNHRMYYVTTRDFNSFSQASLFFDGGFNVIDATLTKDDERFLLFVKDETRNPCQKNIRLAFGKSPYGPFEKVTPPLTGSYWAEGPSAIRIGEQWYVYFDKYKLNRIGAIRSPDLIHWEDISDRVRFPPGAQHGSVSRIPFKTVFHLI